MTSLVTKLVRSAVARDRITLKTNYTSEVVRIVRTV